MFKWVFELHNKASSIRCYVLSTLQFPAICLWNEVAIFWNEVTLRQNEVTGYQIIVRIWMQSRIYITSDNENYPKSSVIL